MLDMSMDDHGNFKKDSIYDHIIDLRNYATLLLASFYRYRNERLIEGPIDETNN